MGVERLEQTGKTYIINGEKIKARKKTNNKWFETQDSISYWEDFFKPKIIWKRVGSILRFSYDENSSMALDSTCFATGRNLKYLCCILNSNVGHYLLKDAPKTGTGDLLISVQAIEPIRIPIPYTKQNCTDELLDSQLNQFTDENEEKINKFVYSLYDLTPIEIDFIKKWIIRYQQNK